ncbi:MAG: PorT family protein [Bacteroidales bacterium]|nr:PorT family protein [Bacteroidales bacterium]MBN2756712.1 PorT family protein [Bacteroidales bacterium]
MKKLTFLILLLFVTSVIYSQHRKKRGSEVKWLSIAAKAGYGNSILINSNVMGDNNITMDFLSPAYSFGGRFGVTYGDNFGLAFEVLSSGFSQKYDINDGNNTYSKTQKFTSLDYLIMFRYTSDYGFYFEAGPKFSNLKSASIENPSDFNFTDNETDYIANFKEKYNSIAIGMGFAIFRGERINFNLGLRGSYAITDIVENPNFYVLDDGVYLPEITTLAKTNPFSLKLMFEINYFFGFWGDASCGKGRIMFFQ